MMNSAIEASNRRIVVIVDPHISSNYTYSFFDKGLELEQNDDVVKSDTEVYKTNIFVRTPHRLDKNKVFFAPCWPDNSTWVDFLNEDAQAYWESAFSFENFKGTNYLYSFWNDMNEPSVFGTDSKTLPLYSVHF